MEGRIWHQRSIVNITTNIYREPLKKNRVCATIKPVLKLKQTKTNTNTLTNITTNLAKIMVAPAEL